MARFFSYLTLTPVLFATAFQLQAAGFGINATRLIYPADASSISVTVRNTETQTPYLVQAKVILNPKQQAAAPFVVTPPLFRLEPQSTNQLRVAYTHAALPSDRESVFYFSATAIPASKPTSASQKDNSVYGGLQFGVGNTIKLFYRPQGLQGTAADAQRNLQFSIVSNGLKITNPSPYHVNLAELRVAGKNLALNEPAALMLLPFGSHIWTVKTPLSAGNKAEWKTINDTGGIDAFSTVLP